MAMKWQVLDFFAGSYGGGCVYQNQDMTIHQQAVQGARFFDLDTRHGSDGRLYSVHSKRFGDELSVVGVLLASA